MTLRQTSVLLSRLSLFVIYFWFGLLKVLGQSPASEIVHKTFLATMSQVPFLSFGIFIILFGLFEMLIGLLFIIPELEKPTLILFAIHMITTILPLFIISDIWTTMFVPTLEGQYIIKNLALIACAITVWSSVPPKIQNSVTI